MSAVAVLERARVLGVVLRPDGDALHYRGQRSAVVELLPELETHKSAIIAQLYEREAQCATDAVLYAQALLRQGRFPSEPAPCAHHCGYPNERCKRCASSWDEHYPAL